MFHFYIYKDLSCPQSKICAPMRIAYNQELFRNVSWFESGSGWLLRFGKNYRFDNIYADAKHHASCIRRAVDDDTLNVTSISTRYCASTKTISYYPYGTCKCTACCSWVHMSAHYPMYFAPSNDQNGYYSVLICHHCHEEMKEKCIRLYSQTHTEFRFRNTDTISHLREQALATAFHNRERRSLVVIKPKMLHWAFKYQGPCFNLIKQKYISP